MTFKYLISALLIVTMMTSCTGQSPQNNDKMKEKPVAGIDGNKYVP